ncbi:MAG: hypothetical protein JSR48_04255 [Verrucomicrobia bacterium]|nr:hypothetical protein [Verrucomicrobiota bacterium]
MNARFAPRIRLLLAGLCAAVLAGCSSVHSWVQLGSDHPARAGASVSVPLGK